MARSSRSFNFIDIFDEVDAARPSRASAADQVDLYQWITANRCRFAGLLDSGAAEGET